ncbi:protein kinase domain-containing protein [Roseiconus lacunae]|uniref:protein kinase domain-containing protein n=1 Tax=Roseiconus lacunae TaxID=2605694 RepID=UPI0011F31098|nr:protein kinase [Roseiconus lacunae]
MQTTLCPPPDQLRDYLSGKLDATSSDSVAQHLQDCEDCERTATELETEPDTLVELLQANLPVNSGFGESNDRDSSPTSDSIEILNELMPSELGQYELLSRLGTGGMGAVYLARHKSLDKQVALKLLPALPAQNPEFVARFQREMRAAGKLDHPAIVRTTDAGEQGGIHFLVMDAIDGVNLSCISRAEEKLTIADACEVIRQTAIGLAHAHEKGIVHRDVKPSNLMLDTDGAVRILDFGLAQTGFWDLGSAEITTVGQLMGTLDYMAPEQAERGGAVDYRADLYSLGATLFRLLTGRAPLAAAPNLTPLEKLRLLATHKPPRLRSLRPDVPEALGELVDSMLSGDPAGRPASATHAAELLEPFAEPADLVSLLIRARSKPAVADDSFVVSPVLQRNLADSEQLVPIQTVAASQSNGDQSNTGRRGLFWLFLATASAMLFGGIMMVLELRKGQLVIDSEADVQVKIVSVDSQGQRAEIDELRIEPGTKVTRLQAGKYEITLDAPSDSFGVTNKTFSIRNRETVVATIVRKASEPDSDENALETDRMIAEATPEDPRLNEVVYDGETLDTWLRRLKFERNPKEVSRTIHAINSLADESLREVIEEPLIEFLVSLEGKRREFYTSAIEPLATCTGSEFYQVAADIIKQLDSQETKLLFLRSAFDELRIIEINGAEQYDEFLEVIAGLLLSDSPELADETAFLLRGLADFAAGGDALEFQKRVVERLKSIETLTNKQFWLAYPVRYLHRAARPLKYVMTCEPIRIEVTRRAIEVLTSEQQVNQLVTQAAIFIRSQIKFHLELDSEQRKQVVSHLADFLSKAADTPTRSLAEYLVPRALWDFAAPLTPLGHFGEATEPRVNNFVAVLNLIDVANLQETLSSPLSKFHEAFRETPLHGKDSLRNALRHPQNFSWSIVTKGPGKSLLYPRVVYLQSGFLIGKNATELFARFDERLPADIAKEVDGALDKLEFGTDQEQASAINVLVEFMPERYLSRAATLVENYFSKQIHALPTSAVLELLNRATGDDFIASYVRVLESSSDDNRIKLLRVANFSKIEGFSCSDPEKLEPLLRWCDQAIGQSDSINNQETASILWMLYSLLFETTRTSVTCQERVIDHLEAYEHLGSDYWLVRRLDMDGEGRFGLPMRLAILKKAIAELKNTSDDPESNDCQALAVIISGVESIPELSSPQQNALIDELRNRLDAAAKNPSVYSEIESLSSRYKMGEPRFGDVDILEGDSRESDEKPTNVIVLVLNLLIDLSNDSTSELVEIAKPEITALHHAIEERNVTFSKPLFGRNVWPKVGWESLIARLSKGELVFHVWYLQTGALLGKDVQLLNQRPTDLYQAEVERKLRLVSPGDTLAVKIPGLLPQTGDPPILQAGTAAPVTGIPVTVSDDGTIQLPLIDPLPVKGLDLQQVTQAISKTYVVEQEILRSDSAHAISVNFLVRAGQAVEVRNLSGSSVAMKPEKR